MPVFGIAAPEEAELFKAAADFCRRNGLRFMELRAGMPEGVPVPEGLELLPRGSALPLPQGPAEEREAFLEGLDSRQPVLLPQGGAGEPAGAELLGQLLAQPAQRRRGTVGDPG